MTTLPHAFNKYLLTTCTVASLLAITIFHPTPVYAADFVIRVDRTFTVASKTTMHIDERQTVRCNSHAYFIPGTSTATFTIQNYKEGFDETEQQTKEQSISVTDADGTDLRFTKSQQNDEIIIEVRYPSPLYYGDTHIFHLEYDTPELTEPVGKITNVYIPGIDSKYARISTNSSSQTTTELTYTTSLRIPSSMTSNTSTYPKPTSTKQDGDYTVYSFSTESIIEKTVWHQIGTEQAYYFEIVQPLAASDAKTPDFMSFLTKSKFTLTLPRDYSETNQSVFFTDISPKPDEVFVDKDGNLMATFYLSTTNESSITVEGYLTLSSSGETPIPIEALSATPSDIDQDGDLARYLGSGEYWEVDDPTIQKKAEELATDQTTIVDILTADYNFIVDAIDYDDFKSGERNSRRGALATLQGGSSVCMEYSDLLITLARAQGIPARAAYGYGYDPELPADEQEEHQWVQAWVPDYGWLTIDPTWGETGRTFIGKDLDHALWYVASSDPDTPAPIEVLSSSGDLSFSESSITFLAVDEMPPAESMNTANELLDEIGISDDTATRLMHLIQLSPLGRIVVPALPVCAGTLIGVLILNGIIHLMRRRT